jgi:hypothetical protein
LNLGENLKNERDKMKTYVDEKADFAFEQVMKLAGGKDNYSIHTQGAIYAECSRNENLKNLAGLYLYGSSERAERNLAKLNQAIYQIFLERG